ncbi:MAG: hypothetical protein O2875_06735 [Planctomycetota bacterium]|nr:hypothetical protein [Planctomycetota bacterium]
MNRSVTFLYAFIVMVMATLATLTIGCATTNSSSDSSAQETTRSAPLRPEWESPSSGNAADDAKASTSNSPMKQITLPVDDGTSDGIAVIRWQIFDNPSVISTFFKNHPPTQISIEVQKQLASNGFLVAEVQLSALAKALNDLGGTYANIRAWLGQATTWHQLTSFQIRGSYAVVIDGSTRRLNDGAIQLLMRGWTVPLETGAVTDVEILPAFLAGGEVPGARTTLREPFPSAGFFVSLQRGSVILITGMTPKSSKESSTRRPFAGPPVVPPPTLGEILLTRPNSESDPLPLRPLIVLIPLISANNFFDDAVVESPPVQTPE